ncbi:MAG TPA: hypothetical protein PLL66_03205 [Bacteroidales bacterium]|mgnify:CR=1 FL=1|nr:hypothetical protein [Bacteroidales bacterium]
MSFVNYIYATIGKSVINSLSETTAKVSNLIYFAPFLSLIIVNLTIGEEIRFATIIGLVMIIGGILLQKGNKKYKLIGIDKKKNSKKD